MEGPIEVCIRANCEFGLGIKIEKPITDHGGLGKEIAARVSVQIIVIEAVFLLLAHGEGEGAWRFAGDANEAFPDIGTVQIDGHDIGTEGHENEEGSHRRSRSKEDEVML